MFVWGFLGLPNLKHILFFSRRSSWHHWAFLKSSPRKKIKNKNKASHVYFTAAPRRIYVKHVKHALAVEGKTSVKAPSRGVFTKVSERFHYSKDFVSTRKTFFLMKIKITHLQMTAKPCLNRYHSEMRWRVCVCVCAYCFIIHQASWKECR